MSEPDALDRIVTLAGERAGGADAEAVRAFARAYLRRSGHAPHEDDGVLAAEVVGAFRLAASRNGAPAALRAFTPRRDEHGYEGAGSVLETNTDDLPFLVDSVTAVLRARGIGVQRVVHPIVGTERDAAGRIVGVRHPREAALRESVMHFELDRRLLPEELAALEDVVRDVLADVRCVTGDFPAMLARLETLAADVVATPGLEAQDAAEIAGFLRWLRNEHFVFLGYRSEDGGRRVADHGLLRDGSNAIAIEPEPGELLAVGKSEHVSTVHKRERMDVVVLRRGNGTDTIVGLFTSRAYSEPASATPLLHRKLARILEAEDLIEGSHDYKAAVQLFDSFPKDELFSAPVQDLREAIVALLGLHGDEVRLLLRCPSDGRSASLIASLPGAGYGAALREQLRGLVTRAFGEGARVDVHEVFGEGDRAQLHFSVHNMGGLPTIDRQALESDFRALAHTWDDRVRDELVGALGSERGRVLAARWLGRFPGPYRAAAAPVIASGDVCCLEELRAAAGRFTVGLQQDGGGRTRVSFYTRGPKVELSQATRMLEDLGLRVIEEVATRLEDSDEETWVQAFAVLGADDAPLALDECAGRVSDGLIAVWSGTSESDSLNRLVVTAGLDWRQVGILRAYRRYRQRIGSRYTESFQNDVIAANPALTAKLMRLFELRFDPARPDDPAAREALREEILEDLENVELLDHDRILRNQLGAIEATVRTNVYAQGRDAMAFKLRSGDVPAIPQPAPLFEIYVYAPDMEGIHLRGGRIARGGLRWSDRMDYRTEVYGLMRAQMTKNAIIVPAGAKGGFFIKELPADPKRHYVRYVDALLDVTDNLVEGAVVHPEGVRVHDEDDTYLVVAADKGTATMSDTANELALRRGFWLGDAFASGGSTGYDHKALGITARGAWESVKRHFRELDADPEADVITVVGIGDMSGDVFGNGMLLSRTLRLVAAYDHRHVFIDPDPDPEASWAERKRLFEQPQSSWADYDPSLISAGGGVWPRTAKRIELGPEARTALGVDAAELTPNEVISAILRAPVDLLWNGGIGTVVKASTESDADALDRSSDAIRVDARDLRCRVVGEGGNLGFTQRARIELAAGGGRINADFIDNSAGVGCSDHEVNLKVLLDLAVRAGELDGPARNALLRDVTGDVVRHVLIDSFLQAQILAQEVELSAARLFAYEDLMEALEDEGLLDRAVEALPGTEELGERRRAGRGLERPELAVLLAYAKRSLTDALLGSDLIDDPVFDTDLRAYFPAAVVERFGHFIARHPLRRELVATLVANDVVNALGPTHVAGLVAELGVDAPAVVRAYRIARDVSDARARWAGIEGLGAGVPYDVYLELMRGADTLVEDVARFYLVRTPDADIAATVEAGREAFARLAVAMPELRSEEWRAEHSAVAAELAARGVPEDVALRHGFQPALVHAPDIIEVAAESGRDVLDVGRAAFALGEGLRLEWLEHQIDALPAQTRLQRWAVHSVRDDILAARRVLTQRALAAAPDAPGPAAVPAFLEARAEEHRRLAGFMRALALENATDLAGLSLAVRHLRTLAD